MSAFINDGPIAICDRCKMKRLMRELSPDLDTPALMVCRECKDRPDPYRLPWHPKDIDISVPRARPDGHLDRPSTMTTVNEHGVVVEGPIPADLSVKPSST